MVFWCGAYRGHVTDFWDWWVYYNAREPDGSQHGYSISDSAMHSGYLAIVCPD